MSVSAVATIDTLVSYRSLVEHERYAHHVSSFIPGVVANPDSPDGYDLEDLEALIAPRPALRLRPVDHLQQPLSEETDGQSQQRLVDWLSNLGR